MLSARLLATGQELKIQQAADGIVTLLGLPPKPPGPYPTVIALELAKAIPRARPPSLLVQQDHGRLVPSEAPVQEIAVWDWATTHALDFTAPAIGTYSLDLGVIGKGSTRMRVRIDGRDHPGQFRLGCADYPNTLHIRDLVLTEGRHELQLQSDGKSKFGLYLWRLQPKWRSLGTDAWRVIGPFPTAFKAQGKPSQVRDAMRRSFPPESEPFGAARTYPGVGGHPVGWKRSRIKGHRINFARICGEKAIGLCYARAILASPEDRHVEVLLGCDWWANLLVNRSVVRSERSPEEFQSDGAWFCGWKPSPARIFCRAGENELLVKGHPGSMNNWFTFAINDPGDIQLHL